MANVMIEVPIGELIDRISILTIKTKYIKDKTKLSNILKELHPLMDIAKNFEITKISGLINELRAVNETLWIIEDKIRECERKQDFSGKFIKLARSVYFTNDVRSRIKREINISLDSNLLEEKSYEEYENE